MATIDELIVRLDANLKPLEAKLKRAERLMAGFSSRAERALDKPSAQMAALVNPRQSKPPINNTSREEVRVTMGEGGNVPTQEVVFPAIGKILLDISLSVGTDLATNFIMDSLLSEKFKPEEELFREGFDAKRIQQAFFEFQARSEDLAKAAEEAAIAEDRIVKELGSVRSQEIAQNIQDNLQASLDETVSKVFEGIRASTLEPIRFAELEAIAPQNLRERFEASGVVRDPTRAETVSEILRLAQEDENIELSQALSELSSRIPELTAAIERIESGIPDPETQERIARARDVADPVQRLELEIPEGLGNACDCIRDLFNQLPGRRGIESQGNIQEASLGGGRPDTAFAPDLQALKEQAAEWQRIRDRAGEVRPMIADTRRETIELNRVARDLGFTFSSALEDAIVNGEKFSEILKGLERDILRILTRTLITEPIAAGVRSTGAKLGGGIQGDKPGAGGLEGLLNKAFGTAGVFFGEEEEPAADTGSSDAAEVAAAALAGLGGDAQTAAGSLAGALSPSVGEAAAKTAIETAATISLTGAAQIASTAGGAPGGGASSPAAGPTSR